MIHENIDKDLTTSITFYLPPISTSGGGCCCHDVCAAESVDVQMGAV